MSKCKNCGRNRELTSGIVEGKRYNELCSICMVQFQSGNAFAHRSEKRWQGREFARDVIQPFDGLKPNSAFIKEYPEIAGDYWNETNLRQYG